MNEIDPDDARKPLSVDYPQWLRRIRSNRSFHCLFSLRHSLRCLSKSRVTHSSWNEAWSKRWRRGTYTHSGAISSEQCEKYSYQEIQTLRNDDDVRGTNRFQNLNSDLKIDSLDDCLIEFNIRRSKRILRWSNQKNET